VWWCLACCGRLTGVVVALRRLWGWLFLLALTPAARPVAAQQLVEVTRRVERLAASGSTSMARALVDSVLAASREGSEAFVEALYWHAVLDSTAAGAEQDYLRLAVEYPLAPRASSALLRLAELELARQSRDRARRHLEKLRQEYPGSDQIARAQYLAARLEFDEGQPEKACALLATARTAVDATDVELRNQIIYLHSSCVPANSLAAAVSPDTVARRDTTVRRDVRGPSASGHYAIQVAAYNTQREAATLARQLVRRGLPARVVGARAPFRVRIGRYQTPDEARRVMTKAGIRGIVVDAEPS
jgi:tetratricopeptide (TPR) repeat protein